MKTVAPQRAGKPALVSAPLAPDREFPVRFAPRSDLISLFERPQNSMRWVGSGVLRLDESGIHVTARRLTLFGAPRTTRFIPPAAIRHVFREGNAIRIDVQSGADGAASGRAAPGRWFFRFWMTDADQAAQLVDRLPTSRTIELEGVSGWGDQAATLDIHRAAGWLLGTVLCLAVVVGIWLALTNTSRPHGPPTVTAPRPFTATRSTAARPARMPDSEEVLLARADLQRFNARFEALSVQFSVAFDTLQQGGLSQEEFAAGLEKWLMPQWTTVGAQLPARTSAADSVRAEVDQQLNAAVDAWRVALVTYAHGLRAHDPDEVLRAFDYIKEARAHQSAAQATIAQLDIP